MDHHEKLAWSAQHLHALDLEIKDFLQRNPFTARGHHRHGTREFQIIVDDTPFLPSHWPLMVGDAIHNMRSALDLIIWALIDRSPEKPNATESLKVGYPICTISGRYWGVGDQYPNNGARARQARWIGEEALAVVDSTQPYLHEAPANEHPLAVLSAYSNEDKHRNLAVSAVLATSVSFRFEHSAPEPFALDSFEFHPSGEWSLFSGANLGTLVLGEHSVGFENMEVKPTFSGAVHFVCEDERIPPISIPVLEQLLEALHTEVIAPLDEILVRPGGPARAIPRPYTFVRNPGQTG